MEVLKRGSKGNDVKTLQQYLIKLGYCVTADGDFGVKTDTAVKSFQSSHKLVVDGIVGSKTYNAIVLAASQIIISITDADYQKCAKLLNVDVATIKAVKTVESNGKGIQNGIPTMLFEGHVFWRELKTKGIDPNKYITTNSDILYQKWTRSHYTGKNSGEYLRLKKAIKINEDAAYRSASYGLFQIMGNNCTKCGYKTAKEFFNAMCVSEPKQLEAFTMFIKNTGLDAYLRKHDWAGFAYRYNGSGYAKNKYDEKLKGAYEKYK